jgi:hypothetical protein
MVEVVQNLRKLANFVLEISYMNARLSYSTYSFPNSVFVFAAFGNAKTNRNDNSSRFVSYLHTFNIIINSVIL